MRLLVVEDEEEIADFIQRVLTEDHHAVDIAHNAAIAEELILSEEYDLILLDIMLPEEEGLIVLQRIRTAGFTIPVLILSARGEVTDRVQGLDLGADDYLVKPFAVAELRARVRALLRRQLQPSSSILQIADLALNTESHQVKIADKEVNFTSREYSILEYMLYNKGKLLSKGMIAEHVWDYHFNSDYNLIEVYIRRIRKKIAPVGHLIHTIRNSGYILKEPE